MPNPKVYPTQFPEPWASGWGQDQFGLWMAFSYKGIKQVFRWIEPGSFLMGSPEDESQREDDETQHSVLLTKGFWLADTTVTQALWQSVMQNNPSKFKGENKPVETVSWDDANAFINILNQIKPELALCLPTEAQWEYACRAGTKTPFYFGQQIDASQVNYDGQFPYNNGPVSEYREQTVEVKTLPPNAWGLYEMHGNVLEWCLDYYGKYIPDQATDPTGEDSGAARVLRGGSWNFNGRICRSAFRFYDHPDYASQRIGFRLSRGQ
ncbi:formylglycine-generating enzyme family protein [Methylomonas sp. AM2-LC]|uniref:formylglycine-generating enzyme family protein n=1 Tax=Methylomonas sp. AM2-LC TaxID=3153301 RepID=UPI0032637766